MNEAEALLIWYPVCFALGIAFYLTLPYELSSYTVVITLEAVLLALYLYRKTEAFFKILTYLAVFCLGLCAAKGDALYKRHSIEQNISEIMYLRGKIKAIDYNYADRMRLTLEDVEDYDKPLKGIFKVSLTAKNDSLKPNMCVELLANFPKELSPNPLGTYNFKRENFYKGISGVGYSEAEVYRIDCPHQENRFATWINDVRFNIAKLISENTTPDTQGVIQAISIGDKSHITTNQSTAYRRAGLAHFLAISGLHMGLIVLLVFFLVRSLLFAVQGGRYDFRKLAAFIAILGGIGYFLISGQSVSCVRAFVMTVLVLLGVMLKRRAISLRMWGASLLLVAIIMPQAVISAGGLMSFMAVLALVAFYEHFRGDLTHYYAAQTRWHKLKTYFLGVLITDLVASLATLPYSWYYFHQISAYTTLGNLLAGPVIVFMVMPALLLFLGSLTVGLGAYGVKPLELTIYLLNKITAFVADLAGADMGEHLPYLSDFGVFLLTFGILWLCIWQEKWRSWGCIAIVLGCMTVCFSPRADFVFDGKGRTFAFRQEDGSMGLSPWHKNRFLSTMWTGSASKSKEPDNLVCTAEECVYKERIRFSIGKISLDGKDIPLNNGGYIDLRGKGKVFYVPQLLPRIWD
jgi:competence protein ComEC